MLCIFNYLPYEAIWTVWGDRLYNYDDASGEFSSKLLDPLL